MFLGLLAFLIILLYANFLSDVLLWFSLKMLVLPYYNSASSTLPCF